MICVVEGRINCNAVKANLNTVKWQWTHFVKNLVLLSVDPYRSCLQPIICLHFTHPTLCVLLSHTNCLCDIFQYIQKYLLLYYLVKSVLEKKEALFGFRILWFSLPNPPAVSKIPSPTRWQKHTPAAGNELQQAKVSINDATACVGMGWGTSRAWLKIFRQPHLGVLHTVHVTCRWGFHIQAELKSLRNKPLVCCLYWSTLAVWTLSRGMCQYAVNCRGRSVLRIYFQSCSKTKNKE